MNIPLTDSLLKTAEKANRLSTLFEKADKLNETLNKPLTLVHKLENMGKGAELNFTKQLDDIGKLIAPI